MFLMPLLSTEDTYHSEPQPEGFSGNSETQEKSPLYPADAFCYGFRVSCLAQGLPLPPLRS